MPRSPAPIRPRVKDERSYDKALRQAILNPILSGLEHNLSALDLASGAYTSVDINNRVSAYFAALRFVAPELEASARTAAVQNGNRVKRYHDSRFTATFRRALGVDVRPLLREPEVAQAIAARIEDNVALIRTIPERMHVGLRNRIGTLHANEPFNQAAMRQMLADEYRSSGYNLRRLTRDQNNKMVGQLTRIRQTQVGVEEYEWLTADDRRVRPSHQDNAGKIFRWDDPPVDTGHPGEDILCRCVSAAVISEAVVALLQAA